MSSLTGGEWSPSLFDDYIAFAAGSDSDLMSHLIDAVAIREPVSLFPGDWFGFLVGCTYRENIHWRIDAGGKGLACLCVPSVRNGHLTAEMLDFLRSAPIGLLNLNLFPTLSAPERTATARALRPLLPQSVLSISFSRGFGMTASQLGVFLIHRDHPYVRRFREQWSWFTNFYNALAAKAFLRIDIAELQSVDDARRAWVVQWLEQHDLPSVGTGSYYVKSFTLQGTVPEALEPLTRDALVRFCFKPPI
ncbi:hypothetical protein BH11PLA2_BH11PLA2_09710 [soil metagenome]